MSESVYGPIGEPPKRLRPPLDRYPSDLYLPGEATQEAVERRRQERIAVLREPLAGLDLGGYDELIVTWLSDWDIPTVATIASLLHRARAAGPLPAETVPGEDGTS